MTLPQVTGSILTVKDIAVLSNMLFCISLSFLRQRGLFLSMLRLRSRPKLKICGSLDNDHRHNDQQQPYCIHHISLDFRILFFS